jgi:hypothetical protein
MTREKRHFSRLNPELGASHASRGRAFGLVEVEVGDAPRLVRKDQYGTLVEWRETQDVFHDPVATAAGDLPMVQKSRKRGHALNSRALIMPG